ncbi:GGDEF domain-containing protein [Clostridium magnum]|uniref:Phytochrome-like protein cph2 n=1 Tax=Clostridium magnum DSM 2767 TaxID=1121326 RepID=A0A162TDX7_9CLOT|nr:diguanylate cyclase [Clostridium magnum]KZL92523.1 phytochrome-like protein cph2 [Clostridium magnum DSM 2767]SHI79764.1 diguanylate cyclase (GGDEF) domain-containing protein [Clostridium magnum DSM 2767]
MNNIFSKEENIISNAEKLISLKHFKSIEDEVNYTNLLNEYKELLKQMMKMIKMSDKTQLDLKTISDNFEIISQIDVLTGLYNRRYFNEAYDREWKNSILVKTPISLVMIDVDYFKKYNDTYGHLKGDECLAAIAKEVKQSTRKSRDIVSRFGGEEFIMILPETDINSAVLLAKELLKAVKDLNIAHESSPIDKRITLSIGVASMIANENVNMDIFLKMADDALYEAKNNGRNCIKIYIPAV